VLATATPKGRARPRESDRPTSFPVVDQIFSLFLLLLIDLIDSPRDTPKMAGSGVFHFVKASKVDSGPIHGARRSANKHTRRNAR
jgi:hypothetical protein